MNASPNPTKERISRFNVRWAADFFARELCKSILGHEPGPKDLAFYAALIRSSDGIESLTENLLLSNEFQRKFFTSLAPEMARALYRGILGREPDPAGFEALSQQLAQKENIEQVTAGLVASDEFQHKRFASLAPDLVQGLYRGILGREPDPEGLEAFTQQLTHKENLEPVVAGLATSEEFLQKRFVSLVPEMVQALYRGILGRDPDPENLEASTQQLTQKENLAQMAAGLVASDEFQHKRFASLGPELVQALYRAILERDPDPGGLDAFTQQLTQKENLEGVAATLVNSDEFQHKRFASLAPALVQASYRAILGREASPEELEASTQNLTEKENLEPVVAGLVTSDEFRDKASPFPPSDIVHALYRGILGREPDPEGLEAFTQQLTHKENLEPVVAGLATSEESLQKRFVSLVPEMVQALYRGILGRDPDPENLEASTQQLAQKEDLEQVTAGLVASDEFQNKRFASLAPELVQGLYRGILERDPDPGGLDAFTQQLTQKEDLERVTATLVNSDEFQHKRFASIAPALAQALYRAILGREAGPEELEASTLQLTEKENLEPAVAALVTSEEFRDKASPFPPSDIVHALYRGILGREPDPEGLDAFTQQLTKKEHLERVVASLITSDEFRRKGFAFHAPELAQALYRGILGRDADPEELEAFTQQSAQKENLERLVAGLVASEEFQRNGSAFPVPELALALYRGILGRDPGPKDLETFSQWLAQKDKLEGAVAKLAKTDEFRRKCFAVLAPELVQALYGGILGRDADPEGLKVYSARISTEHKLDGIASELFQSLEYRRKSFATLSRPLLEGLYKGALNRSIDQPAWNTYKNLLAHTGDIAPLLSQIITSHEFRRNYAAAEGTARAKAHARASEGSCWVFVHIPKTGGTSIQHLLAAAFPPDKLYREHNDTLAQQPPEKLLPYSMFAGHFNYDSVAFIPRKSISLLSFVREPVDRLCSYYNFLRAHEPSNVMYAKFHRAANELDMESFFSNSEITVSFEVWNQMTWSLMGARQWEAWQLRLAWSANAAADEEFINTVARPAIRQRLREFSFIGLQDDFDRSARLLCEVLGAPQPEVIPADNTLVDLMKKPDYKKDLKREPMTPARRQLLESLVQLDRVLYEETKVIYSEKFAGYEPSAARPEGNGASSPCVAGVEA